MNKEKIEILYKTMFPEYPDIVTINQLRRMLGISRQFAYELIAKQKIKALKIGNAFKIPKVCVIDYIIDNLGKAEDK